MGWGWEVDGDSLLGSDIIGPIPGAGINLPTQQFLCNGYVGGIDCEACGTVPIPEGRQCIDFQGLWEH